jgi:hypothetical protein
MSLGRALGTFVVALAVAAATARGQTAEAASEPWTFSAAAYGYFVPEDGNYVQPTVTADHGPLHLEARYNYEDRDTGSVWLGYNFAGGEKLAWEVTPILGFVGGETTGVAPGFKGSLGYSRFELYSEAEYVIDGDSSDNFFYVWSELSCTAPEWFRFGIVTQRTRVYDAERDVQRGLLAGFSYGSVDLTGYWFNPDDGDPIVVVALGATF